MAKLPKGVLANLADPTYMAQRVDQSQVELATELGVSSSTVRRYRVIHGLPPTPGKRGSCEFCEHLPWCQARVHLPDLLRCQVFA